MAARYITEICTPPPSRMVLAPTESNVGIMMIGDSDYYVSLPRVEEVKISVEISSRGDFDAAPYTVWETEHGLHGCTCRGFEYHSGRSGRACKHIAAMYAVGLLSRFPPPGCSRRPNSVEPLEKVA